MKIEWSDKTPRKIQQFPNPDYPSDTPELEDLLTSADVDHVAQIFQVHPRRHRGRADQIAEHHRELAALGVAGVRSARRCRLRSRVRLGRLAARVVARAPRVFDTRNATRGLTEGIEKVRRL